MESLFKYSTYTVHKEICNITLEQYINYFGIRFVTISFISFRKYFILSKDTNNSIWNLFRRTVSDILRLTLTQYDSTVFEENGTF